MFTDVQRKGGVLMNNISTNGGCYNEDTFGFIPPEMFFTENVAQYDTETSPEEDERIRYHLEHAGDKYLK